MGRAFDSDSAEKPPFILQKFYDRTVAINGQSVSRIASQPAQIGKLVIGHLPYSNGTFLAL